MDPITYQGETEQTVNEIKEHRRSHLIPKIHAHMRMTLTSKHLKVSCNFHAVVEEGIDH